MWLSHFVSTPNLCLASSQDLVFTLGFHCNANYSSDICSVKQTQIQPEIDCKERKIEKIQSLQQRVLLYSLTMMDWMAVNTLKYSKEKKRGKVQEVLMFSYLLY